MITPTVHKRDRQEYEAEPPKKILIYQDEGTCAPSLQAIKEQLHKTLALSFTTKMVDSNYIKNKNWQEKTYVLIMGGGQCSSWENSLGINGMLNIRRFVANGGRYLGICAGAYFAAATSIFHLQGQQPITKTRPIAFYQGSAVGPIATTHDHLAPQAARAVKINLLTAKGRCYYQGGCAFDITEDSETTRVLARFKKPFLGSAIIACRHELGTAVLCGLHPEFLWNSKLATEKTDAVFKDLVDALSNQEAFRQEIWKTMLDELM